MKKHLFYLIFLCLSFSARSQSLIINEFSNGPSGAQEYIEFVVVDPNFVQTCDGSPPPCVDIRGWIIDDNSGYHGTGGVAAGCNRFSYDPIWECVPLGTIIVIYNNVEPNVNLPSNDLSMTDNNCKLIIPINNTQFFESNSTTPGAVACSYPTTGWLPGGIWTNIGMANTGDCVRLVNLSGCEVFSLCYASVNLNTQIYFNSGNSGTDNVWYFNNGDFNLQSNWSEGCADPNSCGANNQTPGAPNSPLNSSFIAQYNNNCQPILPVTVDAGNSFSICLNSTINLTGIAAGTYTSVAWSGGSGVFSSPNSVNTIYTPGNSDTNSIMLYIDAFNLCGIPTRDSIQIDLIEVNVQVSNNGPYCPNEQIQLSAEAGFNYSWSGPNSFTSSIQNPTINQANSNTIGTYSLIVTDPSTNCQSTFTTTVSLHNLPVIDVTSNAVQITPASCGLSDGSVVGATASGTAPFNYYWSNSSGTIVSTSNNLNSVSTGLYYLVATDANGCKDSTSVNINSLNGPVVPTFQAINPICEGSTQIFTINNPEVGATYTWSLGSTIVQTGVDLTSLTVSNFNSSNSGPYSVEVTTGGCNNFATVSVSVIPRPIPQLTGLTSFCFGSSSLLDASSSAPSSGVQFSWYLNNLLIPNETNSSLSVNSSGNYQVVVSANGCDSISNPLQVIVNALPLIDISNITINQPSCGSNNGSVTSITTSGNSPFTYNWTNGFGNSYSSNIDLTNASAGQYYFVVVDANGCKDSTLINVNSLNGPVVPTFQAINPICEGSTQIFTINNPEVGATYTWSLGSTIVQTGVDLTSLTVSNFNSTNSGPYTVEVSSNGCNNFATVSGTVIPRPIPQLTGLTSFCFGSNSILDASTSTPSSGIQFSWYLNNTLIPNETSSSLTVNSSGNYQVFVSANGCDSISNSLIVNVNPLPTIDITNQVIVQATCGLNNASITSLTANGNSPFTYNWTNGLGTSYSSTIDLTNASAGQYYFVVIDANGCSDSLLYQLNSTPAPQTPLLNGPAQACEGSTVILSVGNVDQNLNYSWNYNGTTIQSGLGLDSLIISNSTLQNSGTYEVVVNDGNCSIDTLISILIIDQPEPLISSSALSFCSGNNVTLNVNSGLGYTYQWYQNGQLLVGENNNTINVFTSGNYQVLVSNNGCDSLTQNIQINELPIPQINTSSVSSCLNQPTQLTASGADTFTWLSSSGQLTGNSISIDSSIAGVFTFTLTGTSSNGCINDTIVTATINNNPNVLINGLQNDSINFCEGQVITLTASGASNYIWSNLSTSNPLNLNLNQNSSIAVVGTDVNGCIDSTIVYINIKPAPVFSQILGTPTICNGYPTLLYLDTTYTNQTYSWYNSLGTIISNTDSVGI